MEILSELLFSAGVSVDGFTIGCSYGVRNLRGRLITNIISAIICATASALAIFFGSVILTFVSPQLATYSGVALLLFLGSYSVIKGLFFQKVSDIPVTNRKISIKESIVLSLTVSVDAFSAGLGYAVMGHRSWLIPVAVGLFHSLFISLGMGFSRKIVAHFNLSKKLLTIISGVIIMLLACARVIFG